LIILIIAICKGTQISDMTDKLDTSFLQNNDITPETTSEKFKTGAKRIKFFLIPLFYM